MQRLGNWLGGPGEGWGSLEGAAPPVDKVAMGPSDPLTWMGVQVGILSLLTLILATAAAFLLTEAGVPTGPRTPPPSPSPIPVPIMLEGLGESRARPCPAAPPPSLGSLQPSLPLASLVTTNPPPLPPLATLPPHHPPVPRKGPVASVVRMCQVYGLEVLPGGCSLSCNQGQGRWREGAGHRAPPRCHPFPWHQH